MAIQDFTAGQVLTAAQMDSLQANDYNWTVSTKTASYVLVAADKGTRVVMNAAGATTITVNTSLFNAGDTLILQNIGAGVCTVTAGTATVSSAGSLAIPQNGSGTLYFTSAGVSIYFPSAATTLTSGLILTTAETSFNAATVNVNNVFSATYTNYKIILKIATSSDQVNFRLRVSGVDSSTGYYAVNYDMYSSNAALSSTAVISNGTSLPVGREITFNEIDIFQPFVAAQTFINNNGGHLDTGTPRIDTAFNVNCRAVHNVSTAYDGFTLFPAAGSTLTGTYTIYGYAKA